VRNCADGTVEVRAAGPASALARLRQDLLEGPPFSRVSAVQEIPPVGRLPAEFQVES
jgi:acylphosphatase